MFDEPLFADESQIRLPTAFATPASPFREDSEDYNPDDDPDEVHRHFRFWPLFSTIGE
jgi:hypothetical protein